MVSTWKQKPLLECVDLLQGLTYSPTNVKNHGLLVLRSSNIKNGALSFKDCVFVDCTIDETKYVRPADILICVRNGSSTLIGKSCVIDQPYNATFGAFMSILRGDTTGYIAHIFTSEIVQSQIRNRSNATINQITKRDFESIIIPIPEDEAEQRRIAVALSDMDSYIAALEKLIAKKHAVKQGTMQELLTGKWRLSGFSGEWVDKPLEKVALDIRTGKKNNEDKTANGRYPFYVRSQQVETIDSYSYDGEAIIVPGEGNIGDIFHYIVGKFDFHQRVYKVSDFAPDYDGKYVYYQMRMAFGKHALKNTSKATVDSLRLPAFKEFIVNLPPTKAEQTAIAEVITDMDAEIDVMVIKLNKARQLKQGMMYELLTGNIRLIEEGNENGEN